MIEYDAQGEERRRPGEWFTVRIESRDGGRVLDAYRVVHGVMFCSRSIAGFEDGEPFSVFELRWPSEGR